MGNWRRLMTLLEAKKKIDSTGEAFLTLTNGSETAFIGQVDKMTTKDGRVKLVWKLPAASHTSSFTFATIHNKKFVFTHRGIAPIRLDVGAKKYEVVWDI